MSDGEVSLPVAPDEKPSTKKRERLKLLKRMSDNPRGDWRIEDIETLCRQVGVTISPPSGGSHYTVSSPYAEGALTVPFARPIKAIYIKKLVALVGVHLSGARAEEMSNSAAQAERKEGHGHG